MAGRGEDNLRPVQTKEEARERGRNGGLKSGEVRRNKKTMREAAKMLMGMPVVYDSVIKGMKQMHIEHEDMTNQMAILISMYKEAMSGNVRAAEFIRDILGDGAKWEHEAARLKMDQEKLEMEKEHFRMQMAGRGDNGDGMPTIINVRPDTLPKK